MTAMQNFVGNFLKLNFQRYQYQLKLSVDITKFCYFEMSSKKFAGI